MATTPADRRAEDGVATTLRVVAIALIAVACLAAFALLFGGVTNRRPLDPASAATLATICAGGVLLVRWMVGRLRRPEGDWLIDVLLAAPSLALLFLAFALPAPGSPVVAHAMIWSMFIAAELAWWVGLRRLSPVAAIPNAGPAAALSDCDANPDAAVMPAEATLRLTRAVADGDETVVIEFREHFEPAQRRTALHAAFSPPLNATPEVHVDQLTGPPASIKVSQAEPFGVRLEVRLERPSDGESELLIRCVAVSPHDSTGEELANDLANNIEQ